MAKSGVDLATYRLSIGMWVASAGSGRVLGHGRQAFTIRKSPTLFFVVFYLFILLRADALPKHGDVERNPGPAIHPADVRRCGGLDSNSNLNSEPDVSTSAPASGSLQEPAGPAPWQLSLLQLNARSLANKLPDFQRTVLECRPCSPDIVAVTETWLDDQVPDSVIQFPGFTTLFRTDRGVNQRGSRGGGVLILARDGLRCSRRPELQFWNESVWMEVLLPGHRSFVIGCVYRPPSSSSGDIDDFAQSIELSLDKIALDRSDVAVVGDFNATSPSWLPSDDYNSAGRALEPVFLQLGLHQCISFPTHLACDGRPTSLLDLVLLSNPSLLLRASDLPPLGKSDHVILDCTFRFKVTAPVSCSIRRLWLYDQADFEKINNRLSDLDWTAVSAATDIDHAWAAWKELFLSVVTKEVPTRMVGKPRAKLPWIDSKLRELIKQKHAAWRACKRFPTSDCHRSAFQCVRNKVTSALRSAEKRYLQLLHCDMRLTKHCDSAKHFWSYIKRVTGRIKISTVPDLTVLEDGTSVTITSDVEKARVLNQHFAKQTRLENIPLSFPELPSPSELSPESFSTTPAEVYDTLSALKPGKAPGLDELPPRLLSLCAKGISVSLCTLFNRSFSEGKVPSAWKEALVVPVFKGGQRDAPANYRPIALLSIVSKTMEKIVLKRLTAFLGPLVTPKQSGFRRKDGTSPQLIRLVQEWSAALDSAHLVAVVFFDFKKAFDRVCLPGLILKLKSAGLQGKALSWCESFLTGRRQRVRLGSEISAAEELHAGVPQGAILSPLFFSIYINDIVQSADAEFNLFADDTSVYITDQSATTLQQRLQAVLDKLARWFQQWAVTINTTKSTVLVLSRKRNVPLLDIQLDGQAIPQVSSHKHLGLVVNSRLSWLDHTNYIRAKAAKKMGLLRRIRRRLPATVIRCLYLACVRPTLEYASGAWGGLGVQDANRLERLQRCAARTIARVSVADHLPHDLLLARAGLEPLASRRSIALAQLVHRLSSDPPKGPTHLCAAFQKWISSAPSPTSNVSLRSSSSNGIRLPRPRTELLRHSPFYRAVSLLNSMPAEAKVSLSSIRAHILSSSASR